MRVAVCVATLLGASLSATPAFAAPTPPAKPSNVTAAANTSTSVTVNWRDNSSNEQGFWLYVDNAYSSPNRAANATSTQIGGLSPGTRYCFKVESYRSDASGVAGSGQSTEACASTPADTGQRPSPAASAQTVASIPGGLRLTWYDNSRNETAWLVHDGSTAPQRSFNVSGGSVGWVSFDWTGMQSGEYKCLHVRGYNQWGVGDWPDNPYWACGTASPPAQTGPAPTKVVTTLCYPSEVPVTIYWPKNAPWDIFRIYRGSTLIDETRIGSPRFQVGGTQTDTVTYYYSAAPPFRSETLGVSAVRGGVESRVTLANDGRPFTCDR